MNKCDSCKYKNYDKDRYYRYCYNVYDYENNFNFNDLKDKYELLEEEVIELINCKNEVYWDYYLKEQDKIRYDNLLLFIEKAIIQQKFFKFFFPDWEYIQHIDDSEYKEFLLDIIPDEFQNCLYKSSKYIFDIISNGSPFIHFYEPYGSLYPWCKFHTYDESISISFIIDFLYKYIGNPYLKQDNTIIKMNEIATEINKKYADDMSKYTEKIALRKYRKGHALLKRLMVKKFGYCFLTEIDEHSLLQISHIKPYKESKNIQEALNPNNVLLLENRYAILLDGGQISFGDDGNILYSSKLSKKANDILNDKRFLKLNISLTNEHKYFLKWHRENIFEK